MPLTLKTRHGPVRYKEVNGTYKVTGPDRSRWIRETLTMILYIHTVYTTV